MNKVIYDWPFKIIMYDKKDNIIFAIVKDPWKDDTTIRFYDYNLQKVIDDIWEWHDKHIKYYWRDQELMDFLKAWPLKQWCKSWRWHTLYLR